MIEPVVFPFTWMDDDTARMLLSCFNRIRVYISTDAARDEFAPDLLENALIDIRNPLSDSGHRVDQLFKEYRQWRQANRGTDIAFFKMTENNIPFFNEDTISFLRQDILQAVPGSWESTTDLLLAARVFLCMTGNYDRHQTEIAASLLSQNQQERSMLAALKGEEDEQAIPGNNCQSVDAGEWMTAERLAAWSLLAAKADPPDTLFVTFSQAVLSAVMDRFKNHGVAFEPIGVSSAYLRRDPPAAEQWRKDLSDFLSHLTPVSGTDPAKTWQPICTVDQADALLTILPLPEVSPRVFLENFCPQSLENMESRKNSQAASTIFAAVIPA